MRDIVIIGAGVIGTAIARELSRYNLDITVVEKTNDIANGTSKANTAIVHAGYDAPFDTLKGKTNVRGNYLYEKVCEELDVPFKRIGSLVVAHDKSEIETLISLLNNGEKLGIKGMKIIDKNEVLKKEPNLNNDIIAALHAPTAGITSPWDLAIAYGENASENGVEMKLNFEVTNIEISNNHFIVKNKTEDIKTKYVINAAGIYADDIYSMVSKETFKITPRRGEYYLLDKTANGLMNSVIFPCPSKMGKGVTITPTVDGNILIGPTSENLSDTEKNKTVTTSSGLKEIKESARKLCDKIPYSESITSFAGLRAESDNDDFIIEESRVNCFINVAGIKSPGLSAAPGIAEMVVEIVEDIFNRSGDVLIENTNFNARRRPRIILEELSIDERNELIKRDPSYGKIICRCEMITEGEIKDAIHRKCGATTLNGIKRRVRPGAGRCQGGFCGPRIVEILSRELGMEMTDILNENTGSNILVSETKN